jgi:hypothetical protein
MVRTPIGPLSVNRFSARPHVNRRSCVHVVSELSRAAPAASFSDAPNAVRTGTGSVTISGLNFGVYCFTPTGSLEDSSDHACTSTSWTSATSAACRVQASRGSPGRGIVRDAMTVVGVVGTRQMFTYDGTPRVQQASWQDAFMLRRSSGCATELWGV